MTGRFGPPAANIGTTGSGVQTEVIKKIQKQITETEYYCDVCGIQVVRRVPPTCTSCGRHLCVDCLIWDDREHTDYPLTFCRHCWDFGQSYRNRIAEIDGEAGRQMAALEKEWYEKAKSYVSD